MLDAFIIEHIRNERRRRPRDRRSQVPLYSEEPGAEDPDRGPRPTQRDEPRPRGVTEINFQL